MTEEHGSVWIVEPIGYDEYGIEGVFATLEGAKASCPKETWHQCHDGSWENDTPADRSAWMGVGFSITKHTVGP